MKIRTNNERFITCGTNGYIDTLRNLFNVYDKTSHKMVAELLKSFQVCDTVIFYNIILSILEVCNKSYLNLINYIVGPLNKILLHVQSYLTYITDNVRWLNSTDNAILTSVFIS